jgi:hypothetical protein
MTRLSAPPFREFHEEDERHQSGEAIVSRRWRSPPFALGGLVLTVFAWLEKAEKQSGEERGPDPKRDGGEDQEGLPRAKGFFVGDPRDCGIRLGLAPAK